MIRYQRAGRLPLSGFVPDSSSKMITRLCSGKSPDIGRTSAVVISTASDIKIVSVSLGAPVLTHAPHLGVDAAHLGSGREAKQDVRGCPDRVVAGRARCGRSRHGAIVGKIERHHVVTK